MDGVLSIIETIIEKEWDYFSHARNMGGKAYCQDDYETFYIMRKSQFLVYDKQTLELYLEDLKKADLVSLKYGYMMKTTDPEAYAEIEAILPPISEEKAAIVEAVVAIHVGMTEDYYKDHPGLLKRARAIHTAEDTKDQTSSETYLRGELLTYGMDTLVSYANHLVAAIGEGRNLVQEILEHELEMYGYPKDYFFD